MASKANTTHVSFVCQRCRQPLKLDPSFNNLERQLVEELTAPLIPKVEEDETINIPTKEEEESIEEDEYISRREIKPSVDKTEDECSDFLILGETNMASMDNLSHRVKVASALFDIMSGQAEVDHPLCEECTDNLLDQLDHQLKITEDECKDYRDFLEKLDTSSDDVEDVTLDAELKQLQGEEAALRQQLEKTETEKEEIQKLIKKEEENAARLEAEEESADNQLKYAQTQLDRLKKTNVFNTTFHIWHNGHFGTINNFRLGRLPSVPVDWNEINAAWGQTVLLLHSLAKKMNLTFQRYRLIPYGSHSYVESLTDKSKELPLFGSGGFRFFWDTKFDQAMVAFLDCLQQFKEEVEKGDTGFCLPYRMEKGKIEDNSTGTSYSIKIQFNSEEQWTKALKFMLTNLKWGLAWVSSQFANK